MDPCSIKIILFVAIIWGGWNRIQSLNTRALLSHGEYQYTKQGSSKVLVIPEAGAPIKHLAGLQQKDNPRENSPSWDKNPSPGSQEQNAGLTPFNILSIWKSKQARKCHRPPQSRAEILWSHTAPAMQAWAGDQLVQFLEPGLLPHLSCSRVMLPLVVLKCKEIPIQRDGNALIQETNLNYCFKILWGIFSPSPFWGKEGKDRSGHKEKTFLTKTQEKKEDEEDFY